MIDTGDFLFPGECGAVMVGPNAILCHEAKDHSGPHKSREVRSDMPFGIRQTHWADSLCVKPKAK